MRSSSMPYLCHKQRVDIIEPPKYEFYLFRSFICKYLLYY